MTSWVNKIRPRGFVVGKTKPPNCDINTLNHWAHLVILLVTKGTGRKVGSER
jgi:hypothetical protein